MKSSQMVSALALSMFAWTSWSQVSYPTQGIVYHLDASRLDLLERTGDLVTAWRSVEGSLQFSNADAACQPTYVASAFGEKGGVRFGYAADGTTTEAKWLDGNAKIENVRTVVLVFNLVGGTTLPGAWGWKGTESNQISLGAATFSSVWGRGFFIGGQAWQDDARIWTPDQATTDKEVEASRAAFGTTHVLIAESPAGVSMNQVPTLGYTIQNLSHAAFKSRYMRGCFAEILVYDRVLTPAERVYLSNALRAKWQAFPSSVWKGGATGVWDDPANWEGGVPDATRMAVVDNATVSVPGQAKASRVVLSGASLAVSGGGLESELLVADPLSSLSLAGGLFRGGLALPVDAAFSSSGVSSLVLTDDAALPTAVSLAGIFRKEGGGRLSFSGDGTHAAALKACAGSVDLAGTHQSFASVAGSGAGFVVNSADGQATVSLTDAGVSEWSVPVFGDVVVKRSTTGGLTFGLVSAGEGDFELDGETAVGIGTGALPYLGNVSLHLDASDRASLEVDGDGRVVAWRSLDGRALTLGAGTGYDASYLPCYVSDGMGGRPAVRFGFATDGTTAQQTHLVAYGASVTNRTVFMVFNSPAQQAKSIPTIYGPFCASLHGFSLYQGNLDAFQVSSTEPSTFYQGRGYVNGATRYDPANGVETTRKYGPYTSSVVPFACGTPQVLCAVLDDGAGARASQVYANASVGMTYSGRYWQGLMSELIVYDRTLSTNEIAVVSKVLMAKWNVTPEVVWPVANTLPQNATVDLAGGAALDLGGMSQTVARVSWGARATAGEAAFVTGGTLATGGLSIAVPQGGFAPLAGDADWVLEACGIVFDGKVTSGKFLQTTGTISGSIGEVSPVKLSGRIVRTAQSLGVLSRGLILLLK